MLTIRVFAVSSLAFAVLFSFTHADPVVDLSNAFLSSSAPVTQSTARTNTTQDTTPQSESAGVAALQAQILSLTEKLSQLIAQKATVSATTNPASQAVATNLSLTRNLSRGSRGDDVKQLQQFLIAKHLLASDSATGYFGALTENAVKEWQSQNGIVSRGLPQTTGYGVVGPRTRAALSLVASSGGQTSSAVIPVTPNTTILQPSSVQGSVAPSPALSTVLATPAVNAPILTRTLSPGATDFSTGGQVSQLQTFLTQAGNYSADVTGNYGPATVAAVQDFQIENNIVASGTPETTGFGSVGPTTLAVINTVAVSGSVGAKAGTTITITQTSALPAAPAAVTTAPPATTAPAQTTPSQAVVASSDLAALWERAKSGALFLNPVGMTVNRCNAVTFATGGAFAGTIIGRVFQGTTGGECVAHDTWTLARYNADIGLRQVLFQGNLLTLPATLSDGNTITTAYDPDIALINDEQWLAFECHGPYATQTSAWTCMMPLKSDGSADVSRGYVAVFGKPSAADPNTIYSASVPTLLVHNGRAYLYWASVKIVNGAWKSTITRGVELRQESGGLRRLFAKDAGTAISADAPSVIDVLGLGSDAYTNTVAFLFDAQSDGTNIYVTAALGGGRCQSPSSSDAGCYRLALARSADALSFRTFNTDLLDTTALPANPYEYARLYRDTNGELFLAAQFLASAGSLGRKAVPSGLQVFYLHESAVPAQTASTPTVSQTTPQLSLTAVSENGFVNLLWSGATSQNGYIVRVADASAANSARLISVSGMSKSLVILPSGLYGSETAVSNQDPYVLGGKTYSFQVSSADGSAVSSTVSAVVPAVSVCPNTHCVIDALYPLFLNRGVDPGGHASWYSQLSSGGMTRNDVAWNFLLSQEFSNAHGAPLGMSDGDFVELLYGTILHRVSDPAGKANWVGALSASTTRRQVFDGVIDSQESHIKNPYIF